jgi:hypothetical protein
MIVRPTKQQREALLAFCQCQALLMSPQPSLTVGLLLGIVQIVNPGEEWCFFTGKLSSVQENSSFCMRS